MNEKSTKKDIIKNIAIVFLAVLLVLTFFSNTFMNYSLPQVSATTARQDTISEQIRGSGTIEAGEKYEVTLEQTREIKSVKVKQGDIIAAGDVLFELEDTDSKELTEAQEQLETLQLEYDKAVLTLSSKSGYDSDVLAINNAEKELDKLKKQYSAVLSGDDPLAAAESEYKAAKSDADTYKKLVEKYNKEIESTGTEDMLDLSPDYYTVLSQAKEDVKTAQTAADKEKEVYDALVNEIGKTSDYQDLIKTKRREIQTEQNNLNNYYMKLYNAGPEDDLDAISEQIATSDLKLKQLNEDLNELLQKASTSSMQKSKLRIEKEKYDKTNKALDDAKKHLADETRRIKLELKSLSDEANAKYEEANKKATDAEETKKDLEDSGSLSSSALVKKIDEKEKEIEKLKTDLAAKQISGASEIESQKLDLKNKEVKIERQKKLVEKLKNDSIDAVVKAKKGGVIETLSVTAGDKLSAGTAAAVITVSDKGYILKISAKAEQANKVRVGDKAEITSFYWGNDMTATLESIKPDQNNPQNGKILSFSITGGNVTIGQTISIALGSKGQQYSSVIPNSALRDDPNGKYVLVMESKPSPLGNRYKAVRYDVEVIAKDDTKCAVNGLMGNEYVITTTTKPFEAGAQVRPAD